MILSFVAALSLAPVRTVVFFGNSLTGMNDVPGRTIGLLRRAAPAYDWRAEYVGCGHLKDAFGDKRAQTAWRSGAYAVVLQAQEISMSHKFRYSQEAARNMAKEAKAKGSKVFLFAEWSRKGIDETAYIEGIYREIADATKTEVIPVGRVWDLVQKKAPSAALISSDGNHAALPGSALAATVLARAVNGASLKGQVADGVPQVLRKPLNEAIDVMYPVAKARG